MIRLDESRNFRHARIIAPFMFIATIASMYALDITQLPFDLLFPSTFIIFGYIMLWKCPRCKKLFGVKVGLISISWPYFNECLHCESKFEKAGDT